MKAFHSDITKDDFMPAIEFRKEYGINKNSLYVHIYQAKQKGHTGHIRFLGKNRVYISPSRWFNCTNIEVTLRQELLDMDEGILWRVLRYMSLNQLSTVLAHRSKRFTSTRAWVSYLYKELYSKPRNYSAYIMKYNRTMDLYMLIDMILADCESILPLDDNSEETNGRNRVQAKDIIALKK